MGCSMINIARYYQRRPEYEVAFHKRFEKIRTQMFCRQKNLGVYHRARFTRKLETLNNGPCAYTWRRIVYYILVPSAIYCTMRYSGITQGES